MKEEDSMWLDELAVFMMMSCALVWALVSGDRARLSEERTRRGIGR